MQIVRESLYNFHKTGDIKSSLGIGILYRRDFESDEDIADWMISILPTILELNEIPEDILIRFRGLSGSPISNYQTRYYDEINPKYINRIHQKAKETGIVKEDDEGRILAIPSWYIKTIEKLKDMGFVPESQNEN